VQEADTHSLSDMSPFACRRERSSSADLDLRSQLAGEGFPQGGSCALADIGSHGGKNARRGNLPAGGRVSDAAERGQEERGGKKVEGGHQGGGVKAGEAMECRGGKLGKDPISVKQVRDWFDPLKRLNQLCEAGLVQWNPETVVENLEGEDGQIHAWRWRLCWRLR